jgi:hypothetical protein
MEKIIESVLGLIETILITGALGFGGAMGLKALHDEARKQAIEALKRPTPSLSNFTRKLTNVSR